VPVTTKTSLENSKLVESLSETTESLLKLINQAELLRNTNADRILFGKHQRWSKTHWETLQVENSSETSTLVKYLLENTNAGEIHWKTQSRSKRFEESLIPIGLNQFQDVVWCSYGLDLGGENLPYPGQG
jgi:hypothetical protein